MRFTRLALARVLYTGRIVNRRAADSGSIGRVDTSPGPRLAARFTAGLRRHQKRDFPRSSLANEGLVTPLIELLYCSLLTRRRLCGPLNLPDTGIAAIRMRLCPGHQSSAQSVVFIEWDRSDTPLPLPFASSIPRSDAARRRLHNPPTSHSSLASSSCEFKNMSDKFGLGPISVAASTFIQLSAIPVRQAALEPGGTSYQSLLRPESCP